MYFRELRKYSIWMDWQGGGRLHVFVCGLPHPPLNVGLHVYLSWALGTRAFTVKVVVN